MTKDLTQGDLTTHIKNLSIPASIGFFFHTMFNITDIYFAGKIDSTAIASLSLSAIVFFMIISLASGMSRGVTAIVGNALGTKNTKKVQNSVVNGYYLALFLSIFVLFISITFIDNILNFTYAQDSYKNGAFDYIHIIIYAIPFYIFSFFSNAILTSSGNTKPFRNILIFNFFLNIILDYWFIYGGLGVEPLGIKGLALSTAFIEFIAMCFLIYNILKIKDIKEITNFKLNFSIIKELLMQGLPPTANMLLMSAGSFILMYFLSSFGVNIVAGYGIGIRIEQIMLLPAIGLSVAVIALVSQNNGAKNYIRIQEVLNKTYKYGFIIYFISLFLVFIFAKSLVSLFTSDINIIHEAILYIQINVVVLIAYILIFINISFLQGIKKPEMIFYIGLFRQIVLPTILFLICFYFSFDIIYYWFSTVISVIIATVYIHYLQKRYLKELLC